MSMPHEFIFGPVPSRRLGRSLGIDVIPAKICTLDCIYCEVGATTLRTLERCEYIPPQSILGEMRAVLPSLAGVDWVTFTGSGEPTLNASLGRLIVAAKLLSTIPVAVITNGTLISRRDVQDDLLAADAVLPSLDAVTPDVFRRLNRPAPGLDPEEMIEGLCSFRQRYRGKIWLEILFSHHFNDTDEEILALKKAIERIGPDKIQLNTVVRPPAFPIARPITEGRLVEIAAILGDRCEIACVSPVAAHDRRKVSSEEIAAMLRRRPMTAEELSVALHVGREAIKEALSDLIDGRVYVRLRHGGKTYFSAPTNRVGSE